ncbi:receptor-interacting serine/threonine-protein kinase 1-like isoform X2 [Argopecten irradians]|uniref:receptor-interacting serine/threonine-protein kinase 1-like isoform X2 n=1 Tax=Argopecten irradians TaxID=31199 RepID=UPI00371C7E0A
MASGGRQSINIIASGTGNYDPEYVNKKLEKAKMKVAAAMQKVQRSQNQVSFGSSTDSSSSDDDDVGYGHHAKGVKKKPEGASIEINKRLGSGAIAKINIESANNVQLGDHNVMVINNARKRKETDMPPSPSITDVTPPPQLTAAQQAVLDSVEVVDERKLNILAGFIGKQWRRIFRKLGLTEEEIDRLHIDYQAAEGIKTVIYKGLVNWKEKNGREATVGKLVQVVYSISNNVKVIDSMI